MRRGQELALTLYCTGNMIARFLTNELSHMGISYTQAIILCKLAETPLQTATQKELKTHLQVTSASMSTVIKIMIKNGFLQQKTDEMDSRINVISLTPKAAALVPKISACLDKAEEKIYAELSNEEKEGFHSLLDRMQNNLNDYTEAID